jgi:hypothetical protein
MNKNDGYGNVVCFPVGLGFRTKDRYFVTSSSSEAAFASPDSGRFGSIGGCAAFFFFILNTWIFYLASQGSQPAR